jgi:hypothetical protein
VPDRLQITPGKHLDVRERTPAALVLEAAYAPGGSAPPPTTTPPKTSTSTSSTVCCWSTSPAPDATCTRAKRSTSPGVPRTACGTRTPGPHARAGKPAPPVAPRRGSPHSPTYKARATSTTTARRRCSRSPRSPTRTATPSGWPQARNRRRGSPSPHSPAPPVRPVARRIIRRDRGALGGPLAGLAFLGGLAAGVAVADAPYPRPGTNPAGIRRYFRGNAPAARISAAGQLVSAGMLARFTATVAQLARESSAQSRTLPVATTATGAAAAASLATSAAISLALTSRAGARKRTAAALHRGLFVAGGPIHTATFGALVGCLSLAGRRSGRLPGALTTAGLTSSAAGALSPLALAIEPAVLLIPAGRMSGLLVIAIAGTRLSRTSATAHDHPATTA